eukprot:jgi/Ulvmu1/11150/UM071_0034.1
MPTASKRQIQERGDVRVAKALCTGEQASVMVDKDCSTAMAAAVLDRGAVSHFLASLGTMDEAALAAAPEAWHSILNLMSAASQQPSRARAQLQQAPTGAQRPQHALASAAAAGAATAQRLQQHSTATTSAAGKLSTCAAPASTTATPPAPCARQPLPTAPHSKRSPQQAAAAVPGTGVHDLAQLLTNRAGAPGHSTAQGASQVGQQSAWRTLTPQRMIPSRRTQRPVALTPAANPSHPSPVKLPTAQQAAHPRTPPVHPPIHPQRAADAPALAGPPGGLPEATPAAAAAPPPVRCATAAATPDGSAASAAGVTHAGVTPLAGAPPPQLVAKSAQPLLAAVAAAAAEDSAEPLSPTAAAGIAQSQQAMQQHKSAASDATMHAKTRTSSAKGGTSTLEPPPASAAECVTPPPAPAGTDSPCGTQLAPEPKRRRACAAAATPSPEREAASAAVGASRPPGEALASALACADPGAAPEQPADADAAWGGGGGAHMHAEQRPGAADEGAGGTPEVRSVPEVMWQFAEAQGVARTRKCRVDAEAAKQHVLQVYVRNEQAAKDKVQEIARRHSVSLPSLLPFRSTQRQPNTFRVAALTSLPFLQACACQLAAPQPGTSATSSCTSATDAPPPGAPAGACIAVPGVAPAALAALLHLIEGDPPAELPLDVACELVAVMQACGANELLAALPEYLAPLLRAVTDREVVWVLACSLRSTPAHLRLSLIDRFVSLTFPPLPVLSAKGTAPPPGTGRPTPSDPTAVASLTIFAIQALNGTGSSVAAAQCMLHMAALPRSPGWLRAACVATACMSCGTRADAALARSACLYSTYIVDAFLRCGHAACCAAVRQVYSAACMQSMNMALPSQQLGPPTRAQHQLLSAVRQQLAVQEQGFEVSMVACSAGKRDVVAHAVPIALTAADACTLHAQISLMRVGDSVLLPLRPYMPQRLMLLSKLQFPPVSAPGLEGTSVCGSQPLQGWQLRAQLLDAAPEPPCAAASAGGCAADTMPHEAAGDGGEAPAAGAQHGVQRAAVALAMRSCRGRALAATVNVGFVPDVGALRVGRAVQSVWDMHDRKNMPHLQPAQFKGVHAHAWLCRKKQHFKSGEARLWNVALGPEVPESWEQWLGVAGSPAAPDLAGKVVFAFACVDLE